MAAPTQSTIAPVDRRRYDDDDDNDHHHSLPSSSRLPLDGTLELKDLAASSSRGNTGSGDQSAVAAGGPTLSSDSTLPSSSKESTRPLPAAPNMAIDDQKPTQTVGAVSATSEKAIDPVVQSSSTQTTPAEGVAADEEPSTSSTSAALAPPSKIIRLDSEAIGPSQETMPQPVSNEAGPVLVITLLLTSGARHPYKIDEKYLTKRNVNVPGTTDSGKKDPFSISVYTLKELILREWRDEWEPQPTSPSSIRLIYFGHFLDDKTSLKESKLNANTANVVHMTVRPQDIVDEEDATKSKTANRDRDGGDATAGCRCVIL